ncbi:DnaJ C-terminal domain-containing protein [Rhizobium helianthi]|uniref:DnaJ C-terminal domain-containing protein n=1 Tax=Rhizobium helianthi TaxID=1132695 RepID=A0ABW4M5B3_9HYPH
MRDPYSLLGVKRDAGPDEIKAAWRSKAKSLHPDHNQDDPMAAKRFSEVGQAYEVLKDPERRRRFDKRYETAQTILQQREAARQAEERAKAARANAEKVMEELARANAQRAQAQAQAQAQQSQSHSQAQQQAKSQAKPQQGAQSANTSESAEDMVERIFGNGPAGAQAAGAKPGARNASTSRPQPNGGRDASAEDGDTDADASPADTHANDASKAPLPLPLQAIELISSLMRRIRGEVPPPEKAPDLAVIATVTLEDLVSLNPTYVTLADEREVRVNLEAGMTDGQQIRLKGQGLRLPGMQRGDLVVTLSVARDERFHVEGHDLHTVLKIKLEDAVLGGEAQVETLGGSVPVSIPAWTGSDQIARVPGLGLLKEDGERGDLIVEFRVLLWEKPDDKVIDLMRHMRYGLYV